MNLNHNIRIRWGPLTSDNIDDISDIEFLGAGDKQDLRISRGSHLGYVSKEDGKIFLFEAVSIIDGSGSDNDDEFIDRILKVRFGVTSKNEVIDCRITRIENTDIPLAVTFETTVKQVGRAPIIYITKQARDLMISHGDRVEVTIRAV